MKYRILIADDHALFVEGLKSLLQQQQSWEVTGITTDGKDVLESVKALEPQLILLDISMNGMNGIEILKTMKKMYPEVKVVMLSTYEEKHMIDRASQCGADGYLRKNASLEELVQCVESVQGNERFFIRGAGTEEHDGEKQHAVVRAYKLSRREWEIVQLIREGYTSKEIAEKLFLSKFTVEAHRKNILQKLGVKNIAGVVNLVQQLNL